MNDDKRIAELEAALDVFDASLAIAIRLIDKPVAGFALSQFEAAVEAYRVVTGEHSSTHRVLDAEARR